MKFLPGGRKVLRLLIMVGSLLASAWSDGTLALEPNKAFHQYVQDRWSIEQGMPQITALSIAEDAEGYIWIGTQLGLGRFDGVRFRNFDPRNTPELPAELIQVLKLGQDGRMWVGTYRGLAYYAHRRFRTIETSDHQQPDVHDILTDPDGRVLVATEEGLYAVQDDGDDTHLVPSYPLPRPALSLIRHDGKLWVGSVGGVWRINEADGSSMFTPLPDDGGVRVIRLETAFGKLWAATNAGLRVLGNKGWEPATEAPQLRSTPVNMLYRDRDNNLWVGAHGGLGRLRDGKLVELLKRGDPDAMDDYRAAFEDHEDNLWLGSRTDGIARMWNGWTRRYSTQEGLHEPLVWSLAPGPNGEIWTGTDQGLAVFRNSHFHQILEAAQLPNPIVYTLFPDVDNTVWVGTRKGLVHIHEDGSMIPLPRGFDTLSGAQINGIIRNQGVLWIASSSGVLSWDGAQTATDPIPSGQARHLLPQSDGSVLVGATNGIWHIHSGGSGAERTANPIPGGPDVLSLARLPDGSLAATTLTGAELLIQRKGRWRAYNASSGLPNNPAFFITVAQDGWLWMAGAKGISRVRLSDLDALDRGEIDQIEGQQIVNERGARFSGQKGYCCNGAGNAKGFVENNTIWLPTRDGLVSLDMGDIDTNRVPPPLSIESYRVDEQWQQVPLSDQAIELPLGRRDLDIDFTALSYRDPLSVRMSYRLIGYDPRWKALEDPLNRSAHYTNLPPGHYLFEVRGANNDQVWNDSPAVFSFDVPAHFTETWLFRILVGLLVILLLWGLQRLKIRRMARQQAELEELVRQRTRDLEAANERLRETSMTDPLTGVRNRRGIEQQLPKDLAFYARQSLPANTEPPVLLEVLVDVDHFKQVNDFHGHPAGDLVLQQLAEMLKQQVRQADYIARWGGEEFLLIFRPLPSTQVCDLVERIRSQVASYTFQLADGEPLALTVSIGFVEVPLFGVGHVQADWERWLELADQALYEVKSGGRNGWCGYCVTARTRVESVELSSRPDAMQLVAAGQLRRASHKDPRQPYAGMYPARET